MKVRATGCFGVFVAGAVALAGVLFILLSDGRINRADLDWARRKLTGASKLVWTDADRKIRRDLSEKLVARIHPQRMTYDSGKVIYGRVVKESDDSVVFTYEHGENFQCTITVPRERIVQIESLDTTVPKVTLRDVRFFRTFPLMQFYKKTPYTILTDESAFEVDRMVQQQCHLFEEFSNLFGPVIADTESRADLQLIFFSDQDAYQAYAVQYGKWLEQSYGFYSLGDDRLAVFHQRDAAWVAEGRKQIETAGSKSSLSGRGKSAQRTLDYWKDRQEGTLLGLAAINTRHVLRHEGAHQLSYTLGVQSLRQVGRGWLTEGISTVCETDPIGAANKNRVLTLLSAKEKNELMTLSELLCEPKCRDVVMYAQTWSLTSMLLQPEYRDLFFAYIKNVKNDPSEPPEGYVEELLQFFPFDARELEARWMSYIDGLCRNAS